MARVEVDAEPLAPAYSIKGLAGRDEVVGDLGRMDLEAPLDTLLVKDVDYGIPPVREVLVATLYLREVVGRKGVVLVPDARSREPVYLRDPEAGRSPRGVLHLVGGAPPHPFRVAVAPNVGGEGRLVPRVYRIADRLANEVVAYGPAVQTVAAQDLPPALD